jgi:xylulokinase
MSSAGKDLILGYDFGTSSVKAALFDGRGAIKGRATVHYPLLLPAPGWAEQRPEDWWDAMVAATRAVLAAANMPASRIAAIGISAQMCGTIPVDRDGTALHNALIWLDTRSDAIARRLLHGWVRVSGYGVVALARWLRLTGGAPNLAGRDPTSKILWFREERPALWPQIHKLLDVKDYLIQRCTGRFVTTPDCAHLSWLFDARPGRQGWSQAILRRLGLDEALLPVIKPATEQAGTLRAEQAAALGLDEGTPVAAGAGDVSAFALASGTRRHGAIHLHVGMSAWLAAHLPKSRVDPFTRVGSVCSADAADYLVIAAQENGGTCVDWAARALGFESAGKPGYRAFERAAAAVEAQVGLPYFLPWLHGERVPIDDKFVRGGFVNLSLDHGRPEMARAVLEGIALNLRWAMRAISRFADGGTAPVRMLGGGANIELLCQIVADVLQRPIERMAAPEFGGALGAAMTAAVAAGLYPGLAEAGAMACVDRRFEPDPRLASLYAERFARFVAAYRRLRPWYRGLDFSAPKHPAASLAASRRQAVEEDEGSRDQQGIIDVERAAERRNDRSEVLLAAGPLDGRSQQIAGQPARQDESDR